MRRAMAIWAENNKLMHKEKNNILEIFNEGRESILQNLIQTAGNASPTWNISFVSQLPYHHVFIMPYPNVASNTSEIIYP